jgi:Fringe-like
VGYNNHIMTVTDLIICVFACATVPKYKDEILKIEETWGKRAVEKGVKVLYFLGEEPTDLIDEGKYIYLKNVRNDYDSASHKQNLGLKHIYENYKAEFVFTCGTDTYVNVDKMLVCIKGFDRSKNLYIGGDGDHRQVGDENIYYHSGGGGFILSKSVLKTIYPKLQNIQNEWENICHRNDVSYLITACDVLMGYIVKDIENIEIVEKRHSFKGCNHKGYAYNNTLACCVDKIKISDIISCHYMTLQDFDDFTSILETNNYFIY